MDRIIISVDVSGVGTRRINVRRNLSVGGLVDEIRGKFNYLEGSYALYMQGGGEALDTNRTLEQHGIREGAQLVFVQEAARGANILALVQAGERYAISNLQGVYLREDRQGTIFELGWQPAVIGRQDQDNSANNRLLAVDLSGFRGADYVSRHHAAITESGTQYFVHGLNPRNPTYLNNAKLEFGEAYALQPGDVLAVGKVVLTFYLRG